MSVFQLEQRACPRCGATFDALTFWDDDTPCDTCRRSDYDAVLADINEANTFTVDSIGGACPTQATGRLSDGRPFYFRARHGQWHLRVGDSEWPTDYGDWPDRRDVIVASGDDPTHGWMEPEDVVAILAKVDGGHS